MAPPPQPKPADDRIGALIASIDDEDRAEALSGAPQRAPAPLANPRTDNARQPVENPRQAIELSRNVQMAAMAAPRTAAQAPALNAGAHPTLPAPPVPNVHPQPKPVQLASLGSSHARHPQIEEGDIGDDAVPARITTRPAAAVVHKPADDGPENWMVQIGAYGSEAEAKSQLARYATRSKDVLGHARRVVTPFNGAAGKLFRARFGNFAESEAREVCRRIMQRGQTCFATQVN
jgi:D-alanyl-D-alanine carboxypeptidase